MEQAESIEFRRTPADQVDGVAGPDAISVTRNIHRVRVATLEDAPDMEEVERLAFPSLFPPTRFAREIDKSNTLYLVATREWTDEEIALGPHALRENGEAKGLFGTLKSIVSLPGKALYQTIGSQRNEMPPEYIAGLVGLWFVMDEAHVVIIGNRPADRRKGIGELLLIAAMEAAIGRGARVVTLEVRGSNKAARALYGKYGFRDVGVRKRYYADNNEDAVIMTTPPVQGDDYGQHLLSQIGEHEHRWGESERRS